MPEQAWTADHPGWAERAARAAYNRVYNRLRGRGLALARAAELAADMTQSAFLKAHQCIGFPHCFSGERHLINWLGVVAYRKGLDELRRKVRPLTAAVAEGLSAEEPHQAGSTVWNCLQQLPGQDRQVLFWYYYDRCTDAQVGERLFPGQASAAALGLRARKVRFAALARLRALLFRHGLDPEEWVLGGAQRAGAEPETGSEGLETVP